MVFCKFYEIFQPGYFVEHLPTDAFVHEQGCKENIILSGQHVACLGIERGLYLRTEKLSLVSDGSTRIMHQN